MAKYTISWLLLKQDGPEMKIAICPTYSSTLFSITQHGKFSYACNDRRNNGNKIISRKPCREVNLNLQ